MRQYFAFALLLAPLISTPASAKIDRDIKKLDMSKADQRVTVTSGEYKLLSGQGFSQGMIGGKYASFLGERVSIPVGAYLGVSDFRASRYFMTAGIGYDLPLGDSGITALFNGNVGLTGRSNLDPQLLFEPLVGLAVELERGLRLSATGSAVVYARETQSTGWTMAFGIQFKRFSLVWPD